MRNVCEQTAVRAACMLTLASHGPKVQPSGAEFLGLVRDFKCMLKLAWKDWPNPALDLEVFPSDPKMLSKVSRVLSAKFSFDLRRICNSVFFLQAYIL